MSESITSELYKKYEVTIFERGGWYKGGALNKSYSYSVVVFGVTLNSCKSYKRYGGAQLAAKKLIKKLEYER
jgi:hypothetical protein